MTREQANELADRLAMSDLFICVALKGNRSWEASYGDSYKLVDVAYNTLLSMIDELETVEEQITQIRCCAWQRTRRTVCTAECRPA